MPFQFFKDAILMQVFRYTKRMISDLLQNKVDMSQLVITKALSKAGKQRSTVLQVIF